MAGFRFEVNKNCSIKKTVIFEIVYGRKNKRELM